MISDARQAVYDVLFAASSSLDVEVHRFLPDDVNSVPCLVVGRPTISPGSQSTIYDVDVPVYVVGRRLDDESAQEDLDRLADGVFSILAGRVPGLFGGVELRADPQTSTVASNEVPVYVIGVRSASPLACP